jgi:hypothetical protein
MGGNKKREIIKVAQENLFMLKRLNERTSFYNVDKWNKDYETSQIYKKNHCMYTPIDFNKTQRYGYSQTWGIGNNLCQKSPTRKKFFSKTHYSNTDNDNTPNYKRFANSTKKRKKFEDFNYRDLLDDNKAKPEEEKQFKKISEIENVEKEKEQEEKKDLNINNINKNDKKNLVNEEIEESNIVIKFKKPDAEIKDYKTYLKKDEDERNKINKKESEKINYDSNIINTLLLQMNTLSQKQLSLIDIMDNIQMETQGQIKQLNKRISKLEKNVEDLTNELYYLKNE